MKERTRINLKFSRVDFVYLIQELWVIVSCKPKIPENYNAFCSASESNNKVYLRDRSLEVHVFIRYKHITSLKDQISFAQDEGLPYWFRNNFCGRVCFDLPTGSICFFGST